MLKSLAWINGLAAILCMTVFLAGCADMKTGRKAYEAGDYKTASEHYRKLAEFGLPEAQTNYALMLLKGEAESADPNLAKNLLEKASAQGYPKADLELANLYAKGIAGPVDPEKARALYEQAWNAGQVRAAYQLGRMYEDEGDIGKAKDLYKRAIDKGYYKAAERMGVLLEKKVSPRNPVNALAWYYVAKKHKVNGIERKINRLELSLNQDQREQARHIAEELS